MLTHLAILAGLVSQPSDDGAAASIDAPIVERWLADVPARPPEGVTRDSLPYEQAEPYYRLLTHAGSVDQAALRAAADAQIAARRKESPNYAQFPDMLKNPSRWQGRPVRVKGHVNLLAAVPAPGDDAESRTIYEAWLVSDDSQRFPTVLIADEIPEGMPIGGEVINGVSAAGYFFKLHAYKARDNKWRLAPMIMTGRLEWNPPQPVEPPLSSNATMVVAALATAVIVVGVVALNKRKPRRRRLATTDDVAFDEPERTDGEPFGIP